MKIPKKEQKIEKKGFRSKDTLWERNGKFSQSPTGYLSSAVNVLTNSPKISNFNKGDIFQIVSSLNDEKIF